MSQSVKSEEWVLIADIGGTNARFAAIDASTEVASSDILTIPTDSTPDFPSALQQVIPTLGDLKSLKGMVLAIAGPVDGDVVRLTNASWVFDVRALEHQFGVDKVMFINDFEAVSHSLPHLTEDEYVALQAGDPAPNGHMVVLGPGTGLGVGGLFCAPGGERYPICGEGGHVTYAPQNEQEWRVFNTLKDKYGQVSYERLVSGSGLLAVAKALGAQSFVQSPQDVVQLAVAQKCDACQGAIYIFCSGLGRVAGDVALSLNASSGVYIAGGIMPKLYTQLDVAPVLEAFLDKSRNRDRLERIPLRLITHSNPAFLGLQFLAKNLLSAP